MFCGNISIIDAWKKLSEENVELVDVRTVPEWQFVGIPDLTSLKKEISLISWLDYPKMQQNDAFEADLLNSFGNEKTLLFLCRSGGRSLAAANFVAGLGYQTYNIEGGFEGELDSQNHRNKINGWKNANLPWRQS